MPTPTVITIILNPYLRATASRVTVKSCGMSADADDCPNSTYCNSDNECAPESSRPPMQPRVPAATPAVNGDTHMPSTVPSAEPIATSAAYMGTPVATSESTAEPAATLTANVGTPATTPGSTAEPTTTPLAYVATPEATPGSTAEPAVSSVPTPNYNTHSGEACNDASRADVLLIGTLYAMLHMLHQADICMPHYLEQQACQDCICVYLAVTVWAYVCYVYICILCLYTGLYIYIVTDVSWGLMCLYVLTCTYANKSSIAHSLFDVLCS